MFCASCGSPLTEDGTFCHQCGAPTASPDRSASPKSTQQRLRPRALGIVSLAVAIGVILAVLALSGVIGGGSGGSDEDQIKSMLQREADLLNKRAVQSFYELYSPDSHANCALDDFKRTAGSVFLVIGDNKIEVRDISVDVEGDVAYASYDTYLGGELLNHEEADRFVKVDGRWYDDDEDNDLCQ